MAGHPTPPGCPRPRPGAIVCRRGGRGAQLKLPTGQHLCGLEQGPAVSHVAAEAEVSPEGKRAAVGTWHKAQRVRTFAETPARESLVTHLCVAPEGWGRGGPVWIVPKVLESRPDFPSLRTFCTLRAAVSQPGPSPETHTPSCDSQPPSPRGPTPRLTCHG